MDVFTSDKRSEIMRSVKSKKNTSTELKLIALFKLYHIIGWRRNFPLFGKPDFTFPKRRVAIFTDGCFWHGHDCRNTKPADNADYWQKKIARNKQRDNEVTATLSAKGWTVVRLWECEIKAKLLPDKLLFLLS